jgi:hypothetical protein
MNPTKLHTVFNHRAQPVATSKLVWEGEPFLVGADGVEEPDIANSIVMVNKPGEPIQVSRGGRRYLVISGPDYWDLRRIGLEGPAGIMLDDALPIIVTKA